ncbi:hypothetical protein [Cohnella cholangitidis]|uniref:Uncharacterized protein n=1 Tax=Cohnella cholangitidis TaxID=2598458 RepID=A0A7G5BU71_9BACL|nr:hypothetical protein [Cohnella cholangitidis]QMV40505.1 hypothetical protein FPL14_04255 [Cohnella cholangitidis]
MEGELGSGARIAIALIVIGVIISVIFVILGFTRGTTNSGITTVQNSMDSMSLAQFDDYDQKILSGTQVTSAIKLFDGRPVAMVVRTRALRATPTTAAAEGHNYGALLVGSTPSGSGDNRIFTTVTMSKAALTNSFYTHNLQTTGTEQYNMLIIPTTRSGTPTFIRPTAKFMAELIQDATGTIVGICFTQQ